MKRPLFWVILFLCFPVWADVLEPNEVFPHTFLQHHRILSVLFAMFLTAVIETFLLWCFKYRTWKVLTYFFILNLISNFLVNLGAAELPFHICFTFFNNDCFMYSGGGMLNTVYYYCIPFLELFAVVFEIGLLGLMTGYNKKLWLSVFATNLISFLTGVLLFGL